MLKTESFFKLFILMVVCAVLSGTSIPNSVKKTFHEARRRAVGKKIMSGCQEFLLSETTRSKIFYSEKDKEYLPLIQRTVDFYLPVMLKDYGLENIRVTAVVYPDEVLFAKSMGAKGDQSVMGAYYGGVLNILSPRLWAGDEAEAVERFITSGPIVHELSHFLTDLQTGGNVEVWTSEGVSLYYEYKYTGSEWRPDLLEISKKISLKELRGQFRELDEGCAYRRSFDIVRIIVEEYGEAGLQNVLRGLSEGKRMFAGD